MILVSKLCETEVSIHTEGYVGTGTGLNPLFPENIPEKHQNLKHISTKHPRRPRKKKKKQKVFRERYFRLNSQCFFFTLIYLITNIYIHIYVVFTASKLRLVLTV